MFKFNRNCIKRETKLLASMLGGVLLIFSVCLIADAATRNYSFSFSISNQLVEGTTKRTFNKGSNKMVSSAKTKNPTSGSERYNVSLQAKVWYGYVRGGGKSSILADDTVRTYTWSIPETRTDYTTDVWTSRRLTNSKTSVSGSGTFKNTY